MGILDHIDSLQLSDEEKQAIRNEYEQEINPLRETVAAARAREKKETVKNDVTMLADLIGEQHVGVLKFYRHVLLSDDEEPGLVLLSDDELQLSDDEKVGADGRSEITTAGALKKFVGLLQQAAGTSGKINLTDAVSSSNDGDRPDDGVQLSDDEATKAHKESLSKATGLPVVERNRGRYNRSHVAKNGGGS